MTFVPDDLLVKIPRWTEPPRDLIGRQLYAGGQSGGDAVASVLCDAADSMGEAARLLSESATILRNVPTGWQATADRRSDYAIDRRDLESGLRMAKRIVGRASAQLAAARARVAWLDRLVRLGDAALAPSPDGMRTAEQITEAVRLAAREGDHDG